MHRAGQRCFEFLAFISSPQHKASATEQAIKVWPVRRRGLSNWGMPLVRYAEGCWCDTIARNSVVQLCANLSLYSLHYAKRVTSWGAHLLVIAPAQHSSFQRNVATMAHRWQLCVRFDWPEIWTLNVPLQRRKHCRSTNLPVQKKMYINHNV